MVLNEMQERLCAESIRDFSDLSILFVNCTLKRSDHAIAAGAHPDMAEQVWEENDAPVIFAKVMDADILVLTTPIWLGEQSPVCTKVIERNEDGAKDCEMNILYSLQHRALWYPPKPMPHGWAKPVRAPPTSTRDPGVPRTTSPTATPRS